MVINNDVGISTSGLAYFTDQWQQLLLGHQLHGVVVAADVVAPGEGWATVGAPAPGIRHGTGTART